MTRWAALFALVVPAVVHAGSPDPDPYISDDSGESDGDAPPLSVYGFARLDVLADDSRMNDLHAPHFVMPEPEGGRIDGEMTMTPRMSRLGLSIDEWEIGRRLTTQGTLEVDFGGGSGVNALRLRHAYAQLTYFKVVEILAGQTWDLISPLAPSVQTDTQLMFAGNTGDRRPQFRITGISEWVRFGVAAAATGAIDPTDMDGDGQPDGIAAARPSIQVLLEYGKKDDGMRVGIWGHAGRDGWGDGTHHEVSAYGGHLFLPLGEMAVLLGEVYAGTNASDIGGGIGQGVNVMTGDPIRAAGAWGELSLLPTSRHALAIGTSYDSARQGDLSPGDRRSNQTIYSGLRYRPKSAIQLGIEHLYWRTRYVGMEPGVANRFDMHLSVFF